MPCTSAAWSACSLLAGAVDFRRPHSSLPSHSRPQVEDWLQGLVEALGAEYSDQGESTEGSEYSTVDSREGDAEEGGAEEGGAEEEKAEEEEAEEEAEQQRQVAGG